MGRKNNRKTHREFRGNSLYLDDFALDDNKKDNDLYENVAIKEQHRNKIEPSTYSSKEVAEEARKRADKELRNILLHESKKDLTQPKYKSKIMKLIKDPKTPVILTLITLVVVLAIPVSVYTYLYNTEDVQHYTKIQSELKNDSNYYTPTLLRDIGYSKIILSKAKYTEVYALAYRRLHDRLMDNLSKCIDDNSTLNIDRANSLIVEYKDNVLYSERFRTDLIDTLSLDLNKLSQLSCNFYNIYIIKRNCEIYTAPSSEVITEYNNTMQNIAAYYDHALSTLELLLCEYNKEYSTNYTINLDNINKVVRLPDIKASTNLVTADEFGKN